MRIYPPLLKEEITLKTLVSACKKIVTTHETAKIFLKKLL